MKPQFICVGFAKCGTTTLHEILQQHKSIKLPYIKEPFYYAFYQFYKKGFRWYLKRYYGNKSSDQQCVGEINPLIASNFNAKRIYKDFGPDIKLIFMMRNPVDRLFSDFKMWLLWGGCFDDAKDNLLDENTFKKYIDQHFEYDKKLEKLQLTKPHPLISRSFYYKQIRDYLRYFPRENMKFILFEKFVKDPQKYCEEIFEFIGVDQDVNIDYTVNANSGNRSPRNVISIRLCRFWVGTCWAWITEKLPYVNDTVCKTLNDIYWRMFDLLSKKDGKKYFTDDKLKKDLENYFREDKENLEEFLGTDLSEIWFR